MYYKCYHHEMIVNGGMMRTIIMLLACTCAIALAACGDKDAEDTSGDTASVDTESVESE